MLRIASPDRERRTSTKGWTTLSAESGKGVPTRFEGCF